MFQACMVWGSKERMHKKLHVPICVGEFIWLRGTESPERFVRCTGSDKDIRVTMFDGDGVPLMTMGGIVLIETTANMVESMIQQQSSHFPTMWEEIWRHKPCFCETQITLENVEGQIFSDEVLQKAAEYNKLDDHDREIYYHLVKTKQALVNCNLLQFNFY